MLKCFPPVRWLFSRVLKPKSPLVSLVAFMLLDPGKQPTHRWKTFSHGKISKSVEKNENKVLFHINGMYLHKPFFLNRLEKQKKIRENLQCRCVCSIV